MEEEKKYTLNELKEKLTKKERIFCHQYIIDWNGSRSARVAGYSEDSSKEIAHVKLTKVHIKQYIAFIKNDIEKEAGISKLRQLNELKLIAYSSIEHLHESWIKLEDYEKLKKDNPQILRAIESTESKTEYRTVKEVATEIKLIKLKLYPKLGAISEINKMQGYYEAEKINLSGGVTSLNLIKASESNSDSKNQ